MFQMPESREDSVYLAKLAEQAERYEGEFPSSPCRAITHITFRDGREHEAGRLV
jgi:hypothetical protein